MICNIDYFYPHAKDTEGTKRQALIQNEQLRDAGCPDNKKKTLF